MALTKITDSTPVHDFPSIYNGNLDVLDGEITDVRGELDKNEEKITTLKSDINLVLNKFRAEYIKMIEDNPVAPVSKEYVDNTISDIIGNAPESLNTLGKIASTLNEKVTMEEVEDAISHIVLPDLSNYALKSEIPSIDGLASESWVEGKGYLTEHQDISGKVDAAALGSAAYRDVPSSGNASSSEIVLGSDSRLSDARTPVSHTHTVSEISDFPASLPASDVSAWAKAANKPTYSYSEITNTPTIPFESGTGINSAKLKNTNTTATGEGAIATGYHTEASGAYSTAEGVYSVASGNGSHAEGGFPYKDEVTGEIAYVHGGIASGEGAHAEGGGIDNTSFPDFPSVVPLASGEYSHAENSHTVASGGSSHAEGCVTIASNSFTHAEGTQTEANGLASHVEGKGSVANGVASHAESSSAAVGSRSHSEGNSSETELSFTISGDAGSTTYTTSEEHGLLVNDIVKYKNGGIYSVFAKITEVPSTTSFKLDNTLSSDSAISGGKIYKYDGIAYGQNSHVEGDSCKSFGNSSHAEGKQTIAVGVASHAEGSSTAAGSRSHSEGMNTLAGSGTRPTADTANNLGYYSHSEGNGSQASGNTAHAEGIHTLASGKASHTEGNESQASGNFSHSEGDSTQSTGNSSHAEGKSTVAAGIAAHAEGQSTQTNNRGEHAGGYFNKSSKANNTFGNKGNTTFSHGIGTPEGTRKNAFEIMENGDIYIYGKGGYDGTNAGQSGVKSLQQILTDLGV